MSAKKSWDREEEFFIVLKHDLNNPGDYGNIVGIFDKLEYIKDINIPEKRNSCHYAILGIPKNKQINGTCLYYLGTSIMNKHHEDIRIILQEMNVATIERMGLSFMVMLGLITT